MLVVNGTKTKKEVEKRREGKLFLHVEKITAKTALKKKHYPKGLTRLELKSTYNLRHARHPIKINMTAIANIEATVIFYIYMGDNALIHFFHHLFFLESFDLDKNYVILQLCVSHFLFSQIL